MTTSVIQFHAAPEELAQFISDVAKDLNLHIVLFRFRPSFSCEVVRNPQDLKDTMDLRDGQQVVLLVNEPKLGAANQLVFFDDNPEFISFHFGSWLPQGLRQSSMGYSASDAATIAAGKETSKRLKKISKAGVLVTNPDTGASSMYKGYRYTDGALTLQNSGVQMLPMGGNLAKLGG